jgi:group I intron endonuclease
MHGFIYKTTNLINNKQYIGLCTREDDNYLGSGKLLKQAIAKYGKNNFKREILEISESFDELLELEEYYIEKFSAVESPNYYNLAKGGKAGNSNLLKEY